MNVRIISGIVALGRALGVSCLVVTLATAMEGGAIVLFRPTLFDRPYAPSTVSFTLANHDRLAASVSFVADGSKQGGGVYRLDIQDLAGGCAMVQPISLPAPPKCVAGHPLLPRFYVGTWKGEILAIDLIEGEFRYTWLGQPVGGLILSVHTSPDGEIVVARGRRTVAAWNSRSGEPLWEQPVSAACLSFAARSGKLFCGLVGGDIVELNPHSGQTMITIPAPDCTPIGIAASPDGSRVASCGNTGQLVMWNVATGCVLWSEAPATRGVPSFSHDGQLLIVPQADGARRALLVRRAESGLALGSACVPVGCNRTLCSRDGIVFAWGASAPPSAWRVQVQEEKLKLRPRRMVELANRREPTLAL